MLGNINGNQLGQGPDLRDIGSMLKQFYRDLRDDIRTSISETSKNVGDRISAVEHELRDLTLQVEELRVLESTQGSGTAKMSTPWKVFEKKLKSLTPHCDRVFNEDVLERVSQSYIPQFFVLCAKEPGQELEVFCEAFRALILSVLPQKTRQMYSTPVGKKHSRLKHYLIFIALLNTQENIFNNFKPLADGDGIGGTSPCTPANGESGGNSARKETNSWSDGHQIVQPAWLGRGFISTGHIGLVRSRIETAVGALDDNDSADEAEQAQGSAKQRWLVVKERPTERDIAISGALKVYRRINKYPNNGREKGRVCFFEELGYLLVGWKHVMKGWMGKPINFDQRDVIINWAFPEFPRDECLSSVPDTKRYPSGGTMAWNHNLKAFSDFLALRNKIIIILAIISDSPAVRSGLTS